MPSKMQQNVDLVIDRFVERVNGSLRQTLDPDDVPEFLRDGPPPQGAFDSVSWAIVRAPSHCKWVDEFEAKLPGRLPRSYKSLISRYLFPTLEIGTVTLFANTGVGVEQELVEVVFQDIGICTPLLAGRYVQFGRPSTGSYDPVCFDLNRRTNAGECPVVRLDHEAALTFGRLRVVGELASSFLALVEVTPEATDAG